MVQKIKDIAAFIAAMVFAVISFILSVPFMLVAAYLEHREQVPVVQGDRAQELRRLCQIKHVGDSVAVDGKAFRVIGVNTGRPDGFFQLFLEDGQTIQSELGTFELARAFPPGLPFGVFKRIPFRTIE